MILISQKSAESLLSSESWLYNTFGKSKTQFNKFCAMKASKLSNYAMAKQTDESWIAKLFPLINFNVMAISKVEVLSQVERNLRSLGESIQTLDDWREWINLFMVTFYISSPMSVFSTHDITLLMCVKSSFYYYYYLSSQDVQEQQQQLQIKTKRWLVRCTFFFSQSLLNRVLYIYLLRRLVKFFLFQSSSSSLFFLFFLTQLNSTQPNGIYILQLKSVIFLEFFSAVLYIYIYKMTLLAYL